MFIKKAEIDKEKLIAELIFTGDIVQDSDKSIPWPEREDRFNRYVELLDAIKGDEGCEVAKALVRSMQAKQDYGAYQTTQHALGRFPSGVYISAILAELPTLIQNNPDWAGELLCSLANSVGTKWESDIDLFNKELMVYDSESAEIIRKYIADQENDGWLGHRVGILGRSLA